LGAFGFLTFGALAGLVTADLGLPFDREAFGEEEGAGATGDTVAGTSEDMIIRVEVKRI